MFLSLLSEQKQRVSIKRAIGKRLLELDDVEREFLSDEGPEFPI